jgi:HSP20 family protein
MAQFSFIPTGESTELAADIRELFEELSHSLPHTRRAYSGECRPSLDVRETDAAVEVSVDVAGVAAEAIRVLFRGGVLVVAGEKAPVTMSGDEQFHLVEREFGRFARAVRLEGAFDVEHAHATLHRGELTVTLPKIADRRGRALRILVTASDRP